MIRTHWAASGLAVMGLTLIGCPLFGVSPNAHAAILAYVSEKGLGEGAAPVAPQETITLAAGSDAFHIWLLTDEHLAGVSLDLAITGDAIRLTGSSTHNPASGAEQRWLPELIRHGTVSDTTIGRIEGGALVGLTNSGRGIGPSASATDAMHESAGGFLFATVSYVTENVAGSATLELSIGHNLIADEQGLATDTIFLGPGDGPVANSSGAGGSLADLLFAPATLAAADFDSDGRVAGRDFAIWQRGFGITGGAMRVDGDATGDGIVNASDLGVWESEFGQTTSHSAAQFVPEPRGVGWLAWLFCMMKRCELQAPARRQGRFSGRGFHKLKDVSSPAAEAALPLSIGNDLITATCPSPTPTRDRSRNRTT